MWSRLLLFALLLLPASALADAKEKVAALAPSGLVLVADADGKELLAQNADEPFVPASITKIVTAWVALEVLGGDYRFQTRFYLDKNRVLYVRGGGDPFLISEELAVLAPQLVAAVGKQPLAGMVLDASYYPGGKLQYDLRRTQRQQRSLGRKANPDHPAGDQSVPSAGPGRSRPHQPRPRPCGEPEIRRRTDRRIHRAGRWQRQG